jgi:hypothetical protein
MTSGPSASPLPSPQHPAVAARAVSEAAQAAADAWARAVEPAESGRALSQLHSVLRDLGIATRGLARYQTAGHLADPAPPDFPRDVRAAAQHLLDASLSLAGVLAAEGLGPVPDPDEPGAALCRASRNAITAWRQPAGTSADRDATVERLIKAIGFLAAAAGSLAADTPRQRTISLLAVDERLAGAAACLARAVPAPADKARARPGDRRSRKGGR